MKKEKVLAELAYLKREFSSLKENIQENFNSLTEIFTKLQNHFKPPSCQFMLDGSTRASFTLRPHQATYIKPSITTTQILMTPLIDPGEMGVYKFRISKSMQNALMVGVVDFDLRKDAHFSFALGNSVVWNGWSRGQVEFGEGEFLATEEGFKEGDLVIMKVELSKGLISWQVEGKCSNMFYHPILKEPHRRFVPYAEFFDIGDTITLQ